MIIEKVSALKAFYYLMSVDGVTEFEEDRFEEIGKQLIGPDFDERKREIIEECQEQMNAASIGDEEYDLIQEGLDKALEVTVGKVSEGIVPRLLVWDMLSLANCDDDYSENENRLISHVVRKLQIEKSVFLEMKQLISTALSVQKEQQVLEQSNRLYSDIRPLVEEIEKRNQIIIEAAKALIADDIIMDEPVKKENSFIETGKKLGDSMASGAKILGDSVLNGGKKLGESVTPVAKNIGVVAAKGANNVAEEASKLLGKLKATTQKKTSGGDK